MFVFEGVDKLFINCLSLPIRVETDRYTRPDQRYCLQPKCKNIVSNLSDSTYETMSKINIIS